ncbi:hypothetical protein [Candidatus Nitrosotenuis uzonensis]|uniref:Uncharacterized protein n=1 Tax=Candidatus Nitrosotenuis uzonensis TaxID=1407055 RepID=V6AQN1_9ARCH|nr:hypothetical protein [Candidatus Nitrosotenuis uzonensis]CDI04855.1 hypothetical protein NITUZ_10050 [Candidatus Nitrosotenuis uzonensis]
MVGQNAIFAAVVIGIAVTVFGVFVWPFWNLIPSYVTEEVLVVYVDDQGRCVAQTADNYLVPIGKCDAKQGEIITTEYDVKIKERLVQSIRRL